MGEEGTACGVIYNVEKSGQMIKKGSSRREGEQESRRTGGN